jgi:hypothetical protein
VKELSSINGNKYNIVIPVFLIPYQENSWQEGHPRLDLSAIHLNSKIIREFDRIFNETQLMTEFINLSEELGLYGENQPGISELLSRLITLKSGEQHSWPWRETLDIDAVGTTNLTQIPNEGIYNTAVL